ncbi:MAG TPA: helix-turn-helix domain-containing protein [Candidatus Baltobacteraceae bacterium]|jgi:transcriptional regulator with XRE-family HTH domain
MFGELLRQHRLAAGIPQETLAERAGLSVETISALERGARQKPYLDTIAQLSRALDLSTDDRAELERAASRRSAIPAVPVNNLPEEISSFVDREHDVVKIIQILTAHRLLTLVGIGGIGKTRLALRVGKELANTRSCGTCFVDFAPIRDALQITSAISDGIGLHSSPDLRRLIAFLRRKTILVILDNCEHLVDDIALTVEGILRACPNVTILATSREPLSIAGEHVHRVTPLELT